jgi:hypothetical protein
MERRRSRDARRLGHPVGRRIRDAVQAGGVFPQELAAYLGGRVPQAPLDGLVDVAVEAAPMGEVGLEKDVVDGEGSNQ